MENIKAVIAGGELQPYPTAFFSPEQVHSVQICTSLPLHPVQIHLNFIPFFCHNILMHISASRR